MMIFLGLGNPGPRYLLTRHNVGFRAVDRLADYLKSPLYKVGYHSFYGRGKFAGQEIIFAKPMTYMNQSGLAAAALCRAFGVPPARLLVVHDDLDLPPYRLRIRPGGGSGGHNGLNSIIYDLNTDDFPRMRIGIGRPVDNDVVEYVLQPLPPEDENELEKTLSLTVEAALVFFREGIDTAMNRFNQKK